MPYLKPWWKRVAPGYMFISWNICSDEEIPGWKIKIWKWSLLCMELKELICECGMRDLWVWYPHCAILAFLDIFGGDLWVFLWVWYPRFSVFWKCCGKLMLIFFQVFEKLLCVSRKFEFWNITLTKKLTNWTNCDPNFENNCVILVSVICRGVLCATSLLVCVCVFVCVTKKHSQITSKNVQKGQNRTMRISHSPKDRDCGRACRAPRPDKKLNM
jgi:hypothetical protein